MFGLSLVTVLVIAVDKISLKVLRPSCALAFKKILVTLTSISKSTVSNMFRIAFLHQSCVKSQRPHYQIVRLRPRQHGASISLLYLHPINVAFNVAASAQMPEHADTSLSLVFWRSMTSLPRQGKVSRYAWTRTVQSQVDGVSALP